MLFTLCMPRPGQIMHDLSGTQVLDVKQGRQAVQACKSFLGRPKGSTCALWEALSRLTSIPSVLALLAFLRHEPLPGFEFISAMLYNLCMLQLRRLVRPLPSPALSS